MPEDLSLLGYFDSPRRLAFSDFPVVGNFCDDQILLAVSLFNSVTSAGPMSSVGVSSMTGTFGRNAEFRFGYSGKTGPGEHPAFGGLFASSG